jgi:hypothetical protein
MAILTTAHVKGQTKEGYDGVLTGLQESSGKLRDLFFTLPTHMKKDGWWQKFGKQKLMLMLFSLNMLYRIYPPGFTLNALTRNCIALLQITDRIVLQNGGASFFMKLQWN